MHFPGSGKRLRSASPPIAGGSSSTGHPIAYTGHEACFYPQAGPAPKAKSKRAKLEDGEQDVVVEKRQKLFRKAVTKQIQERVERVKSQRFFCVKRKRTSEFSEEFSVLGSTGNVYTVTICNVPTCSCPDGSKGNHCKHLLFVLLKILAIPEHSCNLYYQSALLNSELSAIFAHAKPSPADQHAERIAKLYRVATGEEEASTSADGDDGGVKKRLPEEGDACVVCYEDYEVGQEKGLVFCLSIGGCGNCLHQQCFGEWAKTVKPVTCPHCRAKWEQPAGNAAAGPSYSSEGYLNLGAAAGISSVRDTSSYYYGPQRGKKWDGGYGRYGGW